ncbi:MAG: hypothetical protein RL189_1001 [Pseudomonadota bacterium]|jgi:hypothetical protein
MLKLAYKNPEALTPVWDLAEVQKIITLLNTKYRSMLDNERFLVESGYDAHQVQLKVTLERADKSVFYPIELLHVREEAVEQSAAQSSSEELASLMLDYIDVYWQEYLSDGRDVFVPLSWDKHTCEGIEFYIRGFVRNRSLEQQADELFRKHGHGEHEIEPISDDL